MSDESRTAATEEHPLVDQIHRSLDRYDDWLRQQRRRPSYWLWRIAYSLGWTKEPW